MDWRTAFIEQARSDLEVADLLLSDRERNVPRCHILQSLQMSFEKLAKGLGCADDDMAPPRWTHSGATALVRYMERNGSHSSALHKRLREMKQNPKAYLRDIRPLVHTLERLCPKLAGGGPNLEYPWEAPNAPPPSVVPPIRHRFPLDDREIARIINLLRTLLATCD